MSYDPTTVWWDYQRLGKPRDLKDGEIYVSTIWVDEQERVPVATGKDLEKLFEVYKEKAEATARFDMDENYVDDDFEEGDEYEEEPIYYQCGAEPNIETFYDNIAIVTEVVMEDK